MGDQGGISWGPVEKGLVRVEFWRAVPPDEVTGLVQSLHALGQRPQKPLPPAQALRPSRSFGRLPPGVYPYWQRREWNYFILWSIVVIIILVAAIRRNASYFF